jgi:hypothetical protein
VFHNALSYAVELGLLPANPINQVQWRAPTAAAAIHPAAVASPAQVGAILAQVNSTRPELTAFFGCLYYAALRPAEAVALRGEDLILPEDRRGKIILTSACPRTGTPWTSTGTPHEPRGLKHRPAGATRVVPMPPVLVSMLRRHLDEYGSTPDGRLFRGARGGILSESVYGRAWHAARQAALGPDLAATTLARRPYDLRHAALSLWLNASAEPPRWQHGQATAPASCTTRICTASTVTRTSSASGSRPPSTQTPAADRRHNAGKEAVIRTVGTTPDPVRYMYADRRPGPAYSPRPRGPPGPQHRKQAPAARVSAAQTASEAKSAAAGRCPDPAHA